jgi:two-component system chemotaxis response regulator CheY
MKSILVVDDSKTVRVYHKQILEKAGYSVDEAENGMEAVEKSMTKKYDIYLVDINMPIMDGYSFLKELRAKYYKDTPAIMISTEAEQLDRDKAYHCGANLYFIKPSKPDVLLASVKILTA